MSVWLTFRQEFGRRSWNALCIFIWFAAGNKQKSSQNLIEYIHIKKQTTTKQKSPTPCNLTDWNSNLKFLMPYRKLKYLLSVLLHASFPLFAFHILFTIFRINTWHFLPKYQLKIIIFLADYFLTGFKIRSSLEEHWKSRLKNMYTSKYLSLKLHKIDIWVENGHFKRK